MNGWPSGWNWARREVRAARASAAAAPGAAVSSRGKATTDWVWAIPRAQARATGWGRGRREEVRGIPGWGAPPGGVGELGPGVTGGELVFGSSLVCLGLDLGAVVF